MTKKALCKKCIGHPRKIPFEYSKITDYIYIGTNACCKDVFEKSLIKKGICADLSLEEKHLDVPWGVDMFLWMPTKNYQPPALHQLIAGISFLQLCVENKRKVYVHCERGHTRAPTMVIAYFMSQGISFKQAFNNVKRKRPDIHPTKKQIKFLMKIEKYLHEKKKVII